MAALNQESSSKPARVPFIRDRLFWIVFFVTLGLFGFITRNDLKANASLSDLAKYIWSLLQLSFILGFVFHIYEPAVAFTISQGWWKSGFDEDAEQDYCRHQIALLNAEMDKSGITENARQCYIENIALLQKRVKESEARSIKIASLRQTRL